MGLVEKFALAGFLSGGRGREEFAGLADREPRHHPVNTLLVGAAAELIEDGRRQAFTKP